MPVEIVCPISLCSAKVNKYTSDHWCNAVLGCNLLCCCKVILYTKVPNGLISMVPPLHVCMPATPLVARTVRTVYCNNGLMFCNQGKCSCDEFNSRHMTPSAGI